MSVWVEYNPNPVKISEEDDCAVRAVAAALGVDWDEAYQMIAHNARMMGTMMHKNPAWGSVLRQHGFRRAIIPNMCPDCYTAEDFCREHPRGVFVLGFYNHVATVLNGKLMDAFDSSREVPIYYWYRRDDF